MKHSAMFIKARVRQFLPCLFQKAPCKQQTFARKRKLVTTTPRCPARELLLHCQSHSEPYLRPCQVPEILKPHTPAKSTVMECLPRSTNMTSRQLLRIRFYDRRLFPMHPLVAT